jgi:hypothetical protein
MPRSRKGTWGAEKLNGLECAQCPRPKNTITFRRVTEIEQNEFHNRLQFWPPTARRTPVSLVALSLCHHALLGCYHPQGVAQPVIVNNAAITQWV